ncbi:MAG: hypothetical protein ABSG53_08440, partial [Thermoguttaceae bacterium]
TWQNGVLTISYANSGFSKILKQPIAVSYPGARPVAADIDGDGIDDLGFWVPNSGVPSTQKPANWYFLLSGGLSLAEHTTFNVVHYQFGSSVGVPLAGTFASTTTTGVYPPVVLPQARITTSPAVPARALLGASVAVGNTAPQPTAAATTLAAMTVNGVGQTIGSTTNSPAAAMTTTIIAPPPQVMEPAVELLPTVKSGTPLEPAKASALVAAGASLTTSSSVKSTIGSTNAFVHNIL